MWVIRTRVTIQSVTRKLRVTIQLRSWYPVPSLHFCPSDRRWESERSDRLYFLGLKSHRGWWFSHEIKRCLLLERKVMTNLDSILKSRDITFLTKVHIVKAMVFPVVICEMIGPLDWMWELDHKEGWAPKNWCFWSVVLEKTLESPLDSTEIKLVDPKGNQPWIFVGRTDAEAEAPILSPFDTKGQLIGKVPDAGKDWRHDRRWDSWMI